MTYWKSLREYLEAVDKAGNLVTITTPVNKDTQLNPLVSLQYRGLPPDQRKAFLFTNVFDSRGRRYNIPVALAFDAARKPNSLGMQCPPEEIPDRLAQAFMHPVEPRMVSEGPVQEEVHMGDGLLEHGGLDEFPIPITTPGYDASATISQGCWVTKDIETGVRNVGLYRSQLYSPTRTGIHQGEIDADLSVHWRKCRAKGIPLQVAIVLGGPPNLTWVGFQGFPKGVDEYAMAGAITGEPVELVKCKTVDLEVPANADIVIEGEMTTEELMLEAPYGESKGYVGMEELQPFLNVTCITHRKDPILPARVRQLPMGGSRPDVILYKKFRYDLNMTHVLAVNNVCEFTVIKMKMNTDQKEVWRTLEAAQEARSFKCSTVIAVDEDINLQNPNMVWWAVNTRVEPKDDVRSIKFLTTDLRPSTYMPEEEITRIRHRQFEENPPMPEASVLLINATLKWPYSPVCLPRKEFMEEALGMWQKEGLPALKLEYPWYGYDLGFWPEEVEEDARRAVRGEYYKTGEIRYQNRKRIK
ncbi:MAG: UbiD family decarboxylase [Chloroflexi bacterium]|nr:UbiD family decarboxylase [Chloroflexota bacterium]